MKPSNIKDSGSCIYTEVDAIAVGKIVKSYNGQEVPKVSVNIYKHTPNEQILSESFSQEQDETVITIRIASLELDVRQAQGLLDGLKNALEA